MKRNGIDFFPFPSVNSTALKLLEAKYKLRGVAIYLKLLQKIFSEEGYYFQLSDDVILLLKSEFGVNDDIIPDVIRECISRGIFNKSMFDKFNILTSEEIQKEWLNAVRKRKNIEMEEKYRLDFSTKFLEKAEENKKTAEENKKTAEDLNKGKESKVKKSKVNYKESKEKAISTNQKGETRNDTPSLSNNKLKEYKIKFTQETGKFAESDNIELPDNFDIDLLIQRIKESKWLSMAGNMTFNKCINYYEKIISGAYRDDKNIKSSLNISNERTYTTQELNSFATNLDDI